MGELMSPATPGPSIASWKGSYSRSLEDAHAQCETDW